MTAGTVTGDRATGDGMTAAETVTVGPPAHVSLGAGEPHGRWSAGEPHRRFSADEPHSRWSAGEPHGMAIVVQP